MYFAFADDSRQATPSREKTGPLVGIGGAVVPGDQVASLERSLETLCAKIGIPREQQFKWSPGKREAALKALTGEQRLAFFTEVLQLGGSHGAQAIVVAEDTSRAKAQGAATHEADAVALFLERANNAIPSQPGGLVIAGAPGRGTEGKFLANCIRLRDEGTRYSSLFALPLGVVTSPSRHIRCLQLADVIVSCTLARIAGEFNYSPAVFEHIRPLFRKELGRIGGVGLKIHPDYVYANLYHWLLGDTHFVRASVGTPLPIKGRPFESDAGEATSVRS